MADLEFPKNTSLSTKETAGSINKTSKANTDKIIKAIQIAMMANAQATADEWHKKDRVKGIAKAGVEKKLDKIGNNIKRAVSPVIKGLKEVGEKVIDSTKSAISDTYTEVFGSGTLAESIKSTIGTSLKKINDTLVNIGSWLSKKGGKWLKNALVYTMLFFKWLKKFLTGYMLFKAISGIAKMAWGGITGTLSLGGDLLKSIAAKLAGSAATTALVSGIKSLFAGATVKTFISSLLSFLGKGTLYAAILAALGWAGGNTIDTAGKELKFREIDNKIENNELYIPEAYQKPGESIREYKERIIEEGNRRLEVKEASDKDRYENWIKQYPKLASDLGFNKPWWGQDDDKNGWKDYNEDRFEEFKEAIRNINKGIDNKLTQSISDEAKMEVLKNKSILKNAAGVSST